MFSVRQIDPHDKLLDHVDGHFLTSIFPQEEIEHACAQFPSTEEPHVRHFTPTLVFLLLLMGQLYPRLSWVHAWEKLRSAFSYLCPSGSLRPISASAISAQRAHFSHDILSTLMQRCCHPLCLPSLHPSAFFHGWHLVAIDGTLFNAADTPANVKAFGRSTNHKGEGPFPQIQVVALMECATRCVLDLVLSPHADAEQHALPTLLKRVNKGMLLLADRAFFSVWLCEQLESIGAQYLGAVASTVGLNIHTRLSDGSHLATVRGRRGTPYRATRAMTVRIIEYFITDERLGEPGVCYRLVTTLLDEQAFPASELIVLYHDRWEVEIMLDESKIHLREQVRVLRSRTPHGVVQEVFALFLLHYAISAVKMQAATELQVDPDRISFTAAMFHLKEAIGMSQLFEPSALPELIVRLRHLLMVEPLVPQRRLRVHRRELKLFGQKFPRKKREIPPIEPFGPEETFLDFVVIEARPEGRDSLKKRGNGPSSPLPLASKMNTSGCAAHRQEVSTIQ